MNSFVCRLNPAKINLKSYFLFGSMVFIHVFYTKYEHQYEIKNSIDQQPSRWTSNFRNDGNNKYTFLFEMKILTLEEINFLQINLKSNLVVVHFFLVVFKSKFK